MIRNLLATTAVTALLTGSAIAQSDTMTDTMDNHVFDRDYDMETSIGAGGYVEATASQILSSNLLGKQIYTGSEHDAEVIGDVNDLLIAANGDAQAVVIGVGGFLGIGQKEVAVDFSRLNWVETEDGDRRLFMSTTVEELEGAPAFDRSVLMNHEMDTAAFERDLDDALPGAANRDMMDEEIDPMTTASADTMDGMVVVDPATLSAEELIGARVYGIGDEDIGEIGDVLISDGAENVEAYIVDVGGFLGIGEKPVALAAENLRVVADANGTISVRTSFTQDQLNNQPTYSEDAYSENPDLILIR